MKKTIETSHYINAPLAKVWENVKSGENWENWVVLIKDSKMNGTGEGATRICHTHENGDLYETITKVDDHNKVFQYRIDKQEMVPASTVVGTLIFSEEGKGTRLDWVAELNLIEGGEEAFPQIKEMTGQMYAASAQALETISA
ncbi:MAG: SRPBCC family protein [Bacteroidota bacterium]